MTKLSKEFLEIFVRVSDRFQTELAPDVLREAISTADAANTAWINCSDAEDDALLDFPNAELVWDESAKDAVRSGAQLPSRDAVDRARLLVVTTKEDEQAARRALDNANYRLGQVLGDPGIVEAWRKAIEEKCAGLQEKLSAVVTKAEPLATEVSWLLGVSTYLGAMPLHSYPPRVDGGDAVAMLRTLATMAPYSQPASGGNITRYGV